MCGRGGGGSRKLEPQLSHIIFVEIDHEIISTTIRHLPLIQEGKLSVSGESMCTKYLFTMEDQGDGWDSVKLAKARSNSLLTVPRRYFHSGTF